MAGLEQIVRPFQRPDSLARRRLVASRTKIDVTPARISWGTSSTQASQRQVEEINLDAGFEVVHTERWKEVSRKNDVVRITQRITNADGTETVVPENYVDVNRPRSVKFKRVKDPDELADRNSQQVYNSTTIDSAALAMGFVPLIDRGIGREATYELSNDPTGTRIPDGGQSVP